VPLAFAILLWTFYKASDIKKRVIKSQFLNSRTRMHTPPPAHTHPPAYPFTHTRSRNSLQNRKGRTTLCACEKLRWMHTVSYVTDSAVSWSWLSFTKKIACLIFHFVEVF